MKVALFGGSFNPPHVGHVLAVTYALTTGDFDRVIVLPVFSHPFDKALAPFDDRVEMSRLAMGWLPHVEISRVEEHLATPSLTLRTVTHIAERHPRWRLSLLVGADVLEESSKWHAFDELVRRASLFVLGRVGVSHPDSPPAVLPDVSSTQIRDLLRQAPDEAATRELRRLVPASVLRYTRAHGLYR